MLSYVTAQTPKAWDAATEQCSSTHIGADIQCLMINAILQSLDGATEQCGITNGSHGFCTDVCNIGSLLLLLLTIVSCPRPRLRLRPTAD